MLQLSRPPFTVIFTKNQHYVVAGRIPLPRSIHGYLRVSSTNDGRQDSASPARDHRSPSVAVMSEGWNPNALPFRPGAFDEGRREQFFNSFENHAPTLPPQYLPPGFGHASYHASGLVPPPPPPPPPPSYFHNNHQQAYFAAQAEEQARAHYHHWAQQQQQYHGHQGYQQGPPPYGMPPYGIPPHHGAPPHLNGPPPFAFRQQRQPNFQQRAYHQMAMQSQGNFSHGGSNEDIQASTPSGKKFKPGASANSQAKQKDTSTGPSDSAASKKGRYGDNKIILPPPQPTPEYLAQATEEPKAADSPSNILVILDLNGTVLYRPNRNAKTMIERPFLKPFLRYLFQNFKVMVWSSAKPDNVKSLVNQSLDNSLKSQLVAQWARDSFGLSPSNYNQNVQVYKNLKLVWSRDVIQQHHPEYASGARFGQHNTVLIDDSALKANAQPHNLLEIPEFSATPEQMEGDMLREVAGFLEILRQQADVSKLINKQPFKGDGRWNYEWPDEAAGDGEMISKASAKKQKKKNKKLNGAAANEGIRSGSATPQVDDETKAARATSSNATSTPISQATESLSSISLAGTMHKDW